MGRRRGSDPALLWLWRRPVATTPIRPLAWECPYATGAALEKSDKNKQREAEGQGGYRAPRLVTLFLRSRVTPTWQLYLTWDSPQFLHKFTIKS